MALRSVLAAAKDKKTRDSFLLTLVIGTKADDLVSRMVVLNDFNRVILTSFDLVRSLRVSSFTTLNTHYHHNVVA